MRVLEKRKKEKKGTKDGKDEREATETETRTETGTETQTNLDSVLKALVVLQSDISTLHDSLMVTFCDVKPSSERDKDKAKTRGTRRQLNVMSRNKFDTCPKLERLNDLLCIPSLIPKEPLPQRQDNPSLSELVERNKNQRLKVTSLGGGGLFWLLQPLSTLHRRRRKTRGQRGSETKGVKTEKTGKAKKGATKAEIESESEDQREIQIKHLLLFLFVIVASFDPQSMLGGVGEGVDKGEDDDGDESDKSDSDSESDAQIRGLTAKRHFYFCHLPVWDLYRSLLVVFLLDSDTFLHPLIHSLLSFLITHCWSRILFTLSPSPSLSHSHSFYKSDLIDPSTLCMLSSHSQSHSPSHSHSQSHSHYNQRWENLYQNLIHSFTQESFSDPLLARVLLFQLNMHLHSAYRLTFWSSLKTLSRLLPSFSSLSSDPPHTLNTPKLDLPLTGLLHPFEDNQNILTLMHDALSKGHISRDTPVLYLIAVVHLSAYIFGLSPNIGSARHRKFILAQILNAHTKLDKHDTLGRTRCAQLKADVVNCDIQQISSLSTHSLRSPSVSDLCKSLSVGVSDSPRSLSSLKSPTKRKFLKLHFDWN